MQGCDLDTYPNSIIQTYTHCEHRLIKHKLRNKVQKSKYNESLGLPQ